MKLRREPIFATISLQDVDALATYNAERYRGLVHTPEWQEKMAELQRRFNADMAARP